MARSFGILNLSNLLNVFRRRIQLFLIIIALAVVLSGGYAFLATREYDAVALVQLDVGKGESAANPADRQGLPQPDPAQFDTEIGNINSSDVARAVVKRLGLVASDEFGADSADRDALDKTVDAVRDAVAVSRNDETYLVSIRARSKNANMAALIANAFADEALRASAARRSTAASTRAKSIAGQIATLGEQIRQDDAKLAAFRTANGLTDNGGSNATGQELQTLAGLLAQAQSESAQRTAELAQARSQGNSEDSPLLTELGRQRADLIRQKGDIEGRLGPNHPQLQTINRQLADIGAQISMEKGRGSAEIASRARAAQARQGAIQAKMNQLQDQQANQTRESVQADSMARDVDAKRRVYNELAQQQEQSVQESRTAQPVGVVVARASAPDSPAIPNRPLILMLGTLIGVFGGVAAVFGAESFDLRIRSGKEVEQQLRTPFVAAVPRLTPAQLALGEDQTVLPWDFVYFKPMSFYAETLRTVRRTLKLSRKPDAQSSVIAICSSVPAEGKSNFAASLGRVMAQSGDRVVLVDGDLRRSTLNELMDSSPSVGLAEVLTGDVDLADAIVADNLTSLDILPLSEATFRADDLFDQDKFREILEQLRQNYQYILIDTPPILAVNDGRVLASIADHVLLIVRWNSTVVHAARASTARLREDGAALLGAVLTMFERKPGTIDSTEAVYYDKAYSHYYVE